MSEVLKIDQAHETILRLLGARTGLAFRSDQQEGTRHGIQRAMSRSQVKDVFQFAKLIERDPGALDNLIVELTVGETYFIREPAHFEFIRHDVLPEIRLRRGADHIIRLWSAGCASGEEAYSLAIVCEEAGVADKAHVLATDISRAALALAGKGKYREWSLRGKASATAKKYLRLENDGYHVEERIRQRVQFERLNLALDVYPSTVTGTQGLDLILCRNVLIYFDRETISVVARRLFDSLAEGGWLITASGDPQFGSEIPFETVSNQHGVFYRKPRSTPTTPLNRRPKTTTADQLKFTRPPRSEPDARETAKLDSRRPKSSSIEAKSALLRGEYDRAADLAVRSPESVDDCVTAVKALANIDIQKALAKCEESLEEYSLSAELHYLHAVLFMEVQRDEDAAQAARRALFLDSSLAIVHFTLGTILQTLGSFSEAARHFRNAMQICEGRPSSEIVRFAEGETVGQLASTSRAHLTAIENVIKNKPRKQ